MGPYCPCGCAVDEERFGGAGDIWVADGYGSGVVHRFRQAGKPSVDTDRRGSRPTTRCAHTQFSSIAARLTPELYIADRVNTRVLVYDLDGRYLRTFGEQFLNSPSDFAQWGDLLVVAELYGRVAVLDPEDNLLGYIGDDPDPLRPKGGRPGRDGSQYAWPATGVRRRPDPMTRHDRFNSPHCCRNRRRRQPLCFCMVAGRAILQSHSPALSGRLELDPLDDQR